MDTPTPDTFVARRTARKDALKATLVAGLTSKGFIAALNKHGDTLNISLGPLFVGSLDFYGVEYHDKGHLYGTVRFSPALYSYRRARSLYRIDMNSYINLTGLVRRLKAEVPKLRANYERVKASDARETRDRAILKSLGTLPTVGDPSVSVYDGVVDIKLTDLPVEVARRVLAALGTDAKENV
jgi:hypothetical protein